MMLLRIYDRADVLSCVLVIVGMTALVCSVRHARSKKDYICIAGIMAITFAVRFYGYTGKTAVDIILGLLIGLIMFVLVGVERFMRKSEDRFWYTLVYPVIYVLFMYFTEEVKINMPFRMDPYFSCCPVLCQITAIFGIYSLDFLLAWTASVIVFFINNKASKQSGILVVAYGCTLCGVICFGVVHTNQMNAQEAAKTDTVRIACAAGPYCGTVSDASYTQFTLEETLVSFTEIVQDAAEKNAEILLFSEEAYCVSDKDEDTLIEAAKKMATGNDMHIVLAYEVDDTDGSEGGKSINKLCWITNEGEIIYDYTKHCLVPFIETSEYVRGSKNIEPFNINVHGKILKVAAAICYDADFDLFMSHIGKNIDLLLLPTWDWNVIAEEHFSVARLRAISTETTLVRSVYDGWSAVIDSAGNILLRENTNETGYENVLICDIPIR